jgi:hypothetical protein
MRSGLLRAKRRQAYLFAKVENVGLQSLSLRQLHLTTEFSGPKNPRRSRLLCSDLTVKPEECPRGWTEFRSPRAHFLQSSVLR